MTKILTVGVFDYFHYGHLRLFLQARSVADNPFLIVGVQDGEFINNINLIRKFFILQIFVVNLFLLYVLWIKS